MPPTGPTAAFRWWHRVRERPAKSYLTCSTVAARRVVSTKSSPIGQKWATRSRASPSVSLRDGSVARRAPQESDAEGLQVVCFADDSALRAGHHVRGRAERFGQV